MKTCPTCNRTYTDASLNFCLEDGTPLTGSASSSAAPGLDPNATIRYTDPRDTKSPAAAAYQSAPPANYGIDSPATSHGSQFGQQQRSTLTGPGAQGKKSNAVWWILGGLLLAGVVVVGGVIMIIALAGMASNSNSNRANNNSRVANRNANANTNSSNVSNTNANAPLPSSLTDDFSQAKWGTGNYALGDLWYANDQYHMRGKANKYLVMYAPSADYGTANATVRVTARSVDGTPAASGFGLIVNGKSQGGQLEDYALLIYTGTEPRYEIIKHKAGAQTEVKPWVVSKVIRTGTNPNQLEVRTRGSELSFYINGQYVDRISDTDNFKGVAGLYTSDSAEIAFDDLEIKR